MLVLDNARVHSQARLVAIQRDFLNFNFCFLPIYSPELNVAEFFFAKMKNDARRELFTSPQLNLQQWHRKIQAISNRGNNNQRDSSIVLAHAETMCDAMIQFN
jgi:transposase